ncbi:hypothetical protein Dalk_4778 [Desulfatibacillum aliphaticivorans]|uniref:AbiEi antitoxin N-terminal domain-containing protein n=1 Tax=Desulfatibacillum aliphaticivorans TaxID=218208 RepID=B8FD25_DESAL|nr:type IV toxin-antitoxin system AbiEi family antitoxin domain-containing protein [Desulfatibacillum aliphaticivorans]ACL06456.1 hypothetical protein Dalk_4778 [Desulfatibacillum aliphaticivorans]
MGYGLAEKVRRVFRELGPYGEHLTVEEIAQALGIRKGKRRPIVWALCDLKKQGEIERVHRGVYRLVVSHCMAIVTEKDTLTGASQKERALIALYEAIKAVSEL